MLFFNVFKKNINVEFFEINGKVKPGGISEIPFFEIQDKPTEYERFYFSYIDR